MSTATVTWKQAHGRALWNEQTLSYWSKVLADDLVREFDPVEVWLYGSVARGDDTPDSDIDLLIVLDRLDPAHLIELKRRAIRSTTVPAPADIAFTYPSRVATRATTAGTIERAVRRDGTLMYRRG